MVIVYFFTARARLAATATPARYAEAPTAVEATVTLTAAQATSVVVSEEATLHVILVVAAAPATVAPVFLFPAIAATGAAKLQQQLQL